MTNFQKLAALRGYVSTAKAELFYQIDVDIDHGVVEHFQDCIQSRRFELEEDYGFSAEYVAAEAAALERVPRA